MLEYMRFVQKKFIINKFIKKKKGNILLTTITYIILKNNLYNYKY